MKKTAMLLVAGAACLIYGATTWAGSPPSHFRCEDKGFHACPPYDCETTSITLTNCPPGQTTQINHWRSDGTMNGSCNARPTGDCPNTFECQFSGYILDPDETCNDKPPVCDGTITIMGCP